MWRFVELSEVAAVYTFVPIACWLAIGSLQQLAVFSLVQLLGGRHFW